MEQNTDTLKLLDLIPRPGFCAADNIIVKVNSAARGLLIEPGTDVRTLLQTGAEDYDGFAEGCLCLTLALPGGPVDAAVTEINGLKFFLLEPGSADPVFDAMALISRELRKPLDSVMHLADQLLSSRDPQVREQTAQLNRGLFQILRTVGNLSYPAADLSHQELRDPAAILEETLEKARTFLEPMGYSISYTGPDRNIYCLVDAVLLERAVLNLLSNAVKFTESPGTIDVSFDRKGNRLRLQIRDSGSGIADQIFGELFTRYLRQPGIEDNRFGLGLGLYLVRSFASRHGGTVLVDRTNTGGTRITLTMAILQPAADRLRSPRNYLLDYTGGRDHTLVELSDCLGWECYDNTR